MQQRWYVTCISCYVPCHMTCYIAIWKINVIHNIIVWNLNVLHNMLYMIQIWCPSPPPPNELALWLAANWKQSVFCFFYSSSGRPSASARLPRQSLRPSMVLLGCLCHSLLKMNAQDEQQWREIHAKAITVSFCQARKISAIIHCPYQWLHWRGQGAVLMVSSKDANEGTENM